jgi:hypothetical protein
MKLIFIILGTLVVSSILDAQNLKYDPNVGAMLLNSFFKTMRDPEFIALNKQQQLKVINGYQILLKKHSEHLLNVKQSMGGNFNDK